MLRRSGSPPGVGIREVRGAVRASGTDALASTTLMRQGQAVAFVMRSASHESGSEMANRMPVAHSRVGGNKELVGHRKLVDERAFLGALGGLLFGVLRHGVTPPSHIAEADHVTVIVGSIAAEVGGGAVATLGSISGERPCGMAGGPCVLEQRSTL